MKELEVKILDISYEKIKEKFQELWVKYINTQNLKSVFLENTNWKICRIRKEWDNIVINTKIWKVKNGVKINDEFEFISKNHLFDILRFFEAIWFKRKKILKKIRENYTFEDIKISVDDNFEIPRNIEIEWKNIDSIKSFASKIWFSQDDFCELKEDEIFQLYKKERWVMLNNEFEDFEKNKKYFQ